MNDEKNFIEIYEEYRRRKQDEEAAEKSRALWEKCKKEGRPYFGYPGSGTASDSSGLRGRAETESVSVQLTHSLMIHQRVQPRSGGT